MSEAPQGETASLGVFTRAEWGPDWSVVGRSAPTVMVQSVGGSLPAWVTPTDVLDAEALCELVLVRKSLPPAQVHSALAPCCGQSTPPYQIILLPEPEPLKARAATVQPIDMVVVVEPEQMDTVAEALAILSTGSVIIGADLGFVWDAVCQRHGILGRAWAFEGIGNDALAYEVKSWLEKAYAEGYGGGILVFQLLKPDEKSRFTLADLDAFTSTSLQRCGDRRAVLTASLNATVTSVVVIAFVDPGVDAVAEWTEERSEKMRKLVERIRLSTPA